LSRSRGAPAVRRQRQSRPAQVVVKGAREHNLKGVDVSFPRDSLTTFTGVSGSGKSSLAYHTIYQEGQRRFLESLSSYARQFLGRMEKPKVEAIDGLSPTVSIDQKSVGASPRSTVGTQTEVLDFLRLLFARLGTPACPECGAPIEDWSVDRIAAAVLEQFAGEPALLLAPVIRERKGEYRAELAGFRARGFVRARIDGEVRRLDEEIRLARYEYHTIELVVDRLRVDVGQAPRLREGIEQALGLGDGIVVVAADAHERLFSTQRACPNGHGAIPEIEPRLFSFNSPVGACPVCEGLGEQKRIRAELLVRDPSLSIRDGALHGFTKDGRIVYSRIGLPQLEQVAKAHGFDLDTPWRQLDAKSRRVVMHGSGSKEFDFRWQRDGERFSSEGVDRRSFPGLVPHLESIGDPGWARHLDRFRATSPCNACGGTRLGPAGRSVRLAGVTLPEVAARTVADARAWCGGLELRGNAAKIGHDVLREIEQRLRFLQEVGLEYLTLDRRADTLSGGEAQRIRLAAQVGAGLRGILYVLDEPSIGLHPRDQDRLLATLHALRDRGNTVCVVEHDEATIRSSDFVVDVGPGAGVHGGELVVAGPPAAVAKHPRSLTGRYLRGTERIPVPARRRDDDRGALVVRGARHHNLQGIDVAFPLGRFVAVTGVSGSGKSTLVDVILKRALRRTLHDAHDVPGAHDRIDGIELVDKIVEIDQAPIGRTPRSNPATYTGVWDHVRELFAMLPESRLREYTRSRFSFNVPGGRCEGCEGAGVTQLEMQFLAPVEVVCDDCGGRRFNPETLEIRFKEHDVSQVLGLTIEEARALFAALPKIERGLKALCDVGLGYLQLGQPSTTLSGGEAQRVKLATELQRPATGRTVYVLDEPTTGLHFADVHRLVDCLQRLVDGGNTVLVIEHSLDVIRCADWIVDLGPEGGAGGGRVVATGTPEQVAGIAASHTGRALAGAMGGRPGRAARTPAREPAPDRIEIVGARKNNLRGVDASLPLDKLTVVTGPSGSGKSSLVFDTLFGEGQRRFLESLSTYARRFLGRLDRAPVERIDGLGPAIAIDQKAAPRSPRSTVATATEIQDYLRLLWARIGRPHCPTHGQELTLHPPSRIARELARDHPGARGHLLAPLRIPAGIFADARRRREYLRDEAEAWRKDGFVRALVDGVEHRLDAELPDPLHPNSVDLVIDRTRLDDRARIVDAVAQAEQRSGGLVAVQVEHGPRLLYTTDRSCPQCGFAVPHQPHPRWFSFNHHSGACTTCAGLGVQVACAPELLVDTPDRPPFGGAITHRGAAFTFLTRAGGWYETVARAVAEQRGFDLDQPFRKLPRAAQQVLLHGTGDELYEITFRRRDSNSKRKYRMRVPWKGLCTQIEEWYRSPTQESGDEKFAAVMRNLPCPACDGDRLQPGQRHVRVGPWTLPAFNRLTVAAAAAAFEALKLPATEAKIAAEIRKEIRARLGFLLSVGLGYLTLDRSAATLSGGEAQRIRLATQLGNRLVGVLYVLDEPTVGLHPRDTERLLATLFELRDLGNTVVAVEHDEAVIRAADHVLDLGPGAGHHGGTIVASGTPAEVARTDSPTGRWLRGERRIPQPEQRRAPAAWLTLRDVHVHNLRGVDARFPVGVLTAVTGVSGSGKSSLVLDALLPALQAGRVEIPGVRQAGVIVVDQGPIGTTPASNPATYVQLMTPIRTLFAQLPVARAKGFGPGRFSFNVPGGRCETCEGKGQLQVEMHFLADVWVTCETCNGRRYNQETLGVHYRGKSIADVLDMEAAEALALFANHPKLARPLQLLQDVGLGYLRLGQSATTLSGGEAQRIKLVGELARPRREHNVYLLDEPTTGLHLDDVARLLQVLQRLVDRGDTVVVIEHQLDVIQAADWVLELGPEAGDYGGRIVAAGTPEQIAAAKTHTGRFLAARVGRAARRRRSERSAAS
jgi:excinuclease ABC subunit A